MDDSNPAVEMFQSTPLREGRLKTVKNEGLQTLFQSTPLREGRRRNPYV